MAAAARRAVAKEHHARYGEETDNYGETRLTPSAGRHHHHHRVASDNSMDSGNGPRRSQFQSRRHSTASIPMSDLPVQMPPTAATGTGAHGAEGDAFLQLFHPEDTLRQRWTKLLQVATLTIGVVTGFLAAAAYTPSALNSKCNETCPAFYAVAAVPILLVLLVELPLYLYCRSIRQTTMFAIDLVLLCKVAAIATLAFAEPVAPTQPMLLVIAAATIISGTPRFYLHLLVQSVLWWLVAANTIQLLSSARIVDASAPALIAGGIQPTGISGYALSAVAYFVMALSLYALSFIMVHFQHLEDRLVNTTKVTVSVCSALQALDVRAANECIERYSPLDAGHLPIDEASTSGSAVLADVAPDATLMKLLAALVGFMETVVPHVPHWKQLTLGLNRQTAGDPMGAAPTPNNNTNANDDTVSNRSRSSNRSGSVSGGANSPRAIVRGLDEASTRRIATAMVDIGVNRSALRIDDAQHLFNAYGQVLSQLLQTARTHEGSMHSVVGDTVVATWNATGICTRPEYFATRFVWRLRTKPGHDAAAVSGAVASYEARCQSIMVGMSATHFSSPTEEGRTPPIRVLADLARKYNTVLIDDMTADASHVQRNFIFRGVDQVSFLPALQTATNANSKAALIAASAPYSPDSAKSLAALAATGSFDASGGFGGGNSMAGPSPLSRSIADPAATGVVLSESSLAATPTTGVYEVVRYQDARQTGPDLAGEMRKACDVITRALDECNAGRFAEAVALLNAVPYHTRRQRLVARLLSTAAHCADSRAVPPHCFAFRELFLCSRESTAFGTGRPAGDAQARPSQHSHARDDAVAPLHI